MDVEGGNKKDSVLMKTRSVTLTFVRPLLSYTLAFSELGGHFRLEDEEWRVRQVNWPIRNLYLAKFTSIAP